MRLRRSELFLRQYQRLPPPLRKKTVLSYFSLKISAIQVRAKKVVNALDICEARVDLHVRMTFRIEGDTLVFRKVGPHTILKIP